MTNVETSGVQQEIGQKLALFTVARDLGATAIWLRQRADRMDRNIGDLGLESCEAPEGYYLFVTPKHDEDPMDVEVLNFGMAWSSIKPHQYPDGGNLIYSHLGSRGHGFK